MRRVILESPYSGDRRANVTYARRCLVDCLRRGEAPLASHLLYTQVLDDTHGPDRTLGMDAGFVWIAQAEAMVVYYDHGISNGMVYGIAHARLAGLPIEYRKIHSDTECMTDDQWSALHERVKLATGQADADIRRWEERR